MDASDPANGEELPWKKIVASAAHEIRTPLSSLRTSVEILKMNRLDEEQGQKLMTTMIRQIESISGYLDLLVTSPATFIAPANVSHE